LNTGRPRPIGFKAACAFALFAAIAAAGQLHAASKLVLKNAFIEKYKNRVTVEIDFKVDHAHPKPNPISADGEDGDLHFSGRAPDVGLPMVAEIVNAVAPAQKAAVDLVHQKEKEQKKQNVRLAGVWRLWFEHPPAGQGQQIQGQTIPIPENTNPDHVFELHPLTAIGDKTVPKSFAVIPKFTAYDADTAFGYYEKLPLAAKANASATLLSSVKAKYNYAEFVIELTSAAAPVEDGFFALAKVLDREGNTVVDNARRMAFPQGTSPAAIIKSRKKGDRLHVIGIPRLNLERISALTKSAGGAEVKVNLPYEMIIVGVFPD
jgi:hypothetical protein